MTSRSLGFIALSNAKMDVIYDALRGMSGYRLLHPQEHGEAFALAFEDGRLLFQTRTPDAADRWRALEKDGLSSTPAKPPKQAGHSSENNRWPKYLSNGRGAEIPAVKGRGAQSVWAGTRQKDDMEGLWLEADGSESALLARGRFSQPVATPDGDWLVVAKCLGADWSFPNGVVRIHLADRREAAVDLPTADDFAPLAWLSTHGKFLLRRARDEVDSLARKRVGPEQPEFFLVDPATGETARVIGEFRPFLWVPQPPLQPAAVADDFWCAIASTWEEPAQTAVGTYDARTFAFTPMLTVPSVRFASSEMWIDRTAKEVTFIANGDLIRLALPR